MIDNKFFPSTRYQGSKTKIVNWIWNNIKDISFHTCLDAFAGTGSVSYLLKQKGKEVHYNDYLKFNSMIGKALIENSTETLNHEDINILFNIHIGISYGTFIQDNFKNIFYLEEENIWLDKIIANIPLLNNPYKQSIAWFALFQSCIIKRPYNLFHRANLYVRTANIERSFGNKKTWDTSFEEHFLKFIKEANEAIFNNGQKCFSLNYNVLDIPNHYDLVYIDSPYVNSKGIGVDYLDFYHFLEGMLSYQEWNSLILRNYKHLPILGRGNKDWTDKKQIYNSFNSLFDKFKDSTLVISYRDDGIPPLHELINILKQYKKNVITVESKEYQYVLSKNKSKEVLIIAE